MKNIVHLFFAILAVNDIEAQPCPAITSFSITPPTCFGMSNGSIEINYTAGTAPYTVTWSSSLPQTVSSTLSQNISGVPSGAYSATLTDNNGCATSSQITVQQPSILSLITTPNTPICYGQSAQIYAAGQGGTPPYTYSWSPVYVGGGPHTVSPISSTVYYVSTIDANGCSTTTKSIVINVSSPLNIVGSSITTCQGNIVILAPNITSPGNGGPYTYNWSNGSMNTSSITVGTSLPSPNQYTVSISDGCTIPSASAVFTISVNSTPISGFSISAISGCAPLTATLVGSSNGTNDLFNWSESINGNIGSANPQVYTFQNSGNYDVNLVVTNSLTGCSNSTSIIGITVNVCNGLQELIEKNIVNISPNPSQGLLLVSSIDNIEQVEITNYTGQILFSEMINTKTHQLQLQELAEGIYFVKVVFTDGMSVTKKVIKR